VVPFEFGSGPFYRNQRSTTLVVKGAPPGGLRNPAFSLTMEVPMTMHDHHHITDAEDAAFDATMKMVGMGIVLVMIAGMVLGYFYL
jgi:hypothetical protein